MRQLMQAAGRMGLAGRLKIRADRDVGDYDSDSLVFAKASAKALA